MSRRRKAPARTPLRLSTAFNPTIAFIEPASRRARLVAANNADLCAAVFTAHGLPFARDETALVCLGAPPPLYPTIVTLDSDLRTPNGPMRGAVKDSFARLDADALGLSVLFEASWVWRDAAMDTMLGGWRRVTTGSDLAAWENACSVPKTRRTRPSFPPPVWPI